MPIIAVTSTQTGAGKTGVAAALARGLAYRGKTVRLVRAADAEPDRADADAAFFATQEFAPGSPAQPVEAERIAEPDDGATLVVESSTPLPGARVIMVSRASIPQTLPDGTCAVVLTSINGATPSDVHGVPVIALPEDRTLAGFSVDEARALLKAEVLVPGDEASLTCDHLVVAPISSDAGQPYFRRFPTKAVVVRFDKTDMHLAAMQAQPQCLILTGGRRPSDYLFDAAGAQGVPVLLSQTDTENTVIALEGVFDRTRFQGERKVERMSQLIGDRLTALVD